VLDDEGDGSTKESGSDEIAELAETEAGADPKSELQAKSTEELKNMLNTAVQDEKFELASKIRDELNNRKTS
jgi:protein-arginine kinase activator protein McsA